ncbi:ADAMTS-like protein 2 [Ornithorhynchus anatinus]|uniref:ADAMTS-like protein 2 n=1 Tax=Ornithorhynchus anatinus TaxID=9258 RepID=UPI0019D4968C|nr:ADAMTS-like protein 2 [Ornithorhynchus anatinus]
MYEAERMQLDLFQSLSFWNSSEASKGASAWDVEITKWWGEWSSWSTCSRTCGGGVMSRERHCLFQRLLTAQEINTPLCTGQSKHYQLCQQEPCPANADSFKQQQCSSFNAKAFGKYYYHWMPLYPDDYTSISNKPCDLQCTTRSGERQLIAQAQDGTSCKERLYQGVCISGKCEPVGCDGSLYSSQTMDRCRVCGGDGSTCYRVSGSFRKGISQLGYVFVTNIPSGAMDILIIERRKTENILALADEAGHYFFNGNSVIDNPQNFRVAGTLFKYRRPPSLHADGLEYIIAQGPTNQSLNAMYYNFNGKMPYISYDYTVPRVLAPALHTVPPALETPLHLHLPESHRYKNQKSNLAEPRAAVDFNASWISVSTGKVGSRFSPDSEAGDISFDSGGFFQRNSTVQTGGWSSSPGEDGLKFGFRLGRVYQATGQGKEEVAIAGETDMGLFALHDYEATQDQEELLKPLHLLGSLYLGPPSLRLNQIPTSTAIPQPLVGTELLGKGRPGTSQLQLYRRLCHRDSHHAGFCWEMQQLATRFGRRNSTLGRWSKPGGGWMEGPQNGPTAKTLLDSFLRAEARTGDEEKGANRSSMAAGKNPLPGSVSSSLDRFGPSHQVEPLQAPGTESNDFDVRPLGHDDISLADMYRWKVSAYAPCSSSCASGISTSYAMCVRYDGVEVEEAYCDALTRPEPTHELCTGRDCQPRWETSRWSECSRTCGEGHQARTVRCWRMLAPGFDSSVYDEVCQAAGLVRPIGRKMCRSQACGPQWELSKWSECSARCGSTGTVRREVRCSVEPPLCSDAMRPASEKECQGPPCNWHWMASEWGPCSGACGEGRMTRFILCRNMEGKVISDAQCDPATKPLAIYPCGDRNCPAHWVEQEWEPCNASCGRGMKARSVLCAGLENGVYREYPEAHCEASPKPELQAACFKRPCSTWLTTAWSQCSKTCGVGVRMREVKCYQGEELGQGCDPTSKPEAKQVCQVELCPTEAPDDDCEDRATANCALVLKVKLCSHWYYRKACCRSCRGKAP